MADAPLTVGEVLAMRKLRHRFRAGERFDLAEQMARRDTTSLLAVAEPADVSALGASLRSRGLLADEGGGAFSLTERGKDG